MNIQAGDAVRDRREETGKKTRMANLELLRCVAMMMVVVLHYLGKGEILADLSGGEIGGVGLAAWLMEAFCIVAVNVYMLISGYFLSTSSFKPTRLLSLYLQVWVYSAAVGLLAAATGIYPGEEFSIHYLLTLILPVTMGHYWFMTTYIFLYLLLPLFGMAVRNMTRGQMRTALFLLLFVFCILKSVLPARLETDGQGYDCLWYLCVFLTAAYIRRFGISLLQRRGVCLCLYVLGCLGVFGELMALRYLYLRTGSLEHIMKVPIEYNHILPFLAAVGLFGMFLRLPVPRGLGAAVNRIAPYTLGVYLLHENMGVRYQWQKWLGAEGIGGAPELVIRTVAAVVCVFTAGILADMARAFLVKGFHRLFLGFKPYRALADRVTGADRLFSGTLH